MEMSVEYDKFLNQLNAVQLEANTRVNFIGEQIKALKTSASLEEDERRVEKVMHFIAINLARQLHDKGVFKLCNTAQKGIEIDTGSDTASFTPGKRRLFIMKEKSKFNYRTAMLNKVDEELINVLAYRDYKHQTMQTVDFIHTGNRYMTDILADVLYHFPQEFKELVEQASKMFFEMKSRLLDEFVGIDNKDDQHSRHREGTIEFYKKKIAIKIHKKDSDDIFHPVKAIRVECETVVRYLEEFEFGMHLFSSNADNDNLEYSRDQPLMITNDEIYAELMEGIAKAKEHRKKIDDAKQQIFLKILELVEEKGYGKNAVAGAM